MCESLFTHLPPKWKFYCDMMVVTLATLGVGAKRSAVMGMDNLP